VAPTHAPVAAVCFGCSAAGRVGRRAVERTFAWLTAHHRLARDHERDPAVSEAMIGWAAINTITRRLARRRPATRQQRRTFATTS
jgi:hypothetical protein